MEEQKKRTYDGVYNALGEISKETGVDFGLADYTPETFKQRYFTGPGNISVLYDKLNDVAKEANIDFGLGTRDEWLASFGYKQGAEPGKFETLAGVRVGGKSDVDKFNAYKQKIKGQQPTTPVAPVKPQMQTASVQAPVNDGSDDVANGTPWGTAGSAIGQSRAYKPFTPGQVRTTDDPDAEQFPTPYRPQSQLTYAQRDEVKRQNDFAVRQLEKMQREKERRQEPLVDTGNKDVNEYIIKNTGEWEDDLQKGASRISSSVVIPAVDKAIADFDKKAHEVFGSTQEGNMRNMPTGVASGATIFGNLREANQAKDPEKVLDYLKQQMESVYKDSNFVEEIGKEADKMGIDRQTYLDEVIKPQIAKDLATRFDNSMIARELPKSDVEYVVSGLNNSIMGMIADTFLNTKAQRRYKAQAEATTAEGNNPNYQPGTGAELARVGVTFAADAPFFGVYGRVGGQVAKNIAEREIQKMVAKGLSENAARSIVGTALENSVGTRMKNYIMQHIVSGAITMGGFNATSEGARQVRDDDYNALRLLGSTAEGAVTGTAFGATGGLTQALSQPLSGFAKIGAKVAGFGAEAETMYGTEELAKLLQGEEAFTNPYEGSIESLMKLGVMKVSGGHMLERGAQKLMRAREVGAKQAAMETAAEALGRQRTGMNFTPEEEAYVRSEGQSLLDALSNMHPDRAISEVNGKKKLTAEGEQMRQQLSQAYDDFMNNKDIPANVKQKVAQTLGGIYRPGLETGSDIIQNEDGSVVIKTRDRDGNCIQDIPFDSYDAAADWQQQFKSQFSRNDAANMWNNANEQQRAAIVYRVMQQNRGNASLAEEIRRMGPNANPKRLAKNLNRIMQGNERRDQQAEGRELTPEEARNYIQTVIRDGSDEVFNEVYDIMRQEAFPADELNTQRNYWEGKQLTDVEKHIAQVDAQLKEEQLMLLGEDFANEVMQAADYPDEKIAELAARRNVSGPQLKAALEYYNAISKVNGMMDETLKSIDNQVEAANAYVRKNTHPDSGSLIEVTANGRNYYVTAGHFQITPEGKLVGTDNTGMVILRDMETGEIETLNPNDVTVTAVKDPQRLIDANESMDGLRGELMQQADNTIELNPETPETPSEMGDTFIGDDGKMYMVAGQPDGTGNFTWLKFEIGEDGAPVGEPQPLDINEYRKAKSNELDAISRPQEEPLVEEPVVKDNLTTETEAVPEIETPIAEAPAAPKVESETPVAETESEPAPQQRIPVDEKGNLLYEQAKPEDTLADLTENFGEEDAQQMIAQIAENTGRKLDELKNKDLSGITDMAKLAAYKNEVKELQRKHDYWQNLIKQPEPAAEVEPEVNVENNEQDTTGQTVDSQHTGGESDANRDAGESQVQEPRAQEEVTADTEQPQTEGHQTDTGVPPVSGADVPGGTQPEVKAEEPATPQQPEQPQGKTAQQKVYEATVSNNIGKKFEFTDGTGNRNEITIDGIADDGKVQITRQSFDKQGNAVNEPQQLLVDADRIGKGLIEGTMMPATTTEDKLRSAFKGRPAMQNLINVLNEKEMSDMLDAYNDGDSERISELFGELSEAHKEDIILGERNNRNSNVDKILSGPGSREEKLRRIRKEYQGYNDAEVSLSDEALQPTTLEEYISNLHSRVPKKGEGTIAYTTYTTPDGREVVGLQGETGFGKKSGDDTKGFAPWLAKKGEGISLLQYAEGIHSQLPEAMQEQFDVQAVRNAIANMFGSAQTPSDIPLMVIRRGVMQAEQAARRVEEMIIDGGISYQKAHRNFAGRLEQAKLQTNQQPTEGQKEAGNYKKGHLSFGGYHFTIENPAGSKRRGTDANGKAWENTMHNTYGYILGKKGKDGDHLDMFINDHADLDNWNGTVYVVDQVNPKTGKFDESKVLYGFDSEAEARDAYLSNYSRGWKGLGKITGVDKATFDKWLDSSDRQNKEFAQHSIIQQKVENQVKQFDAALKDLNDREISIDNPELLKDYGLKHVTLSRSGDHISLTHFIVDKPGQGYGTRFMEDLARLADQNGWTLTLTPDTAFGAKSLRQLQKFYKRFGFKPNKGRNTDFMTNDSMVRRPADWNPDTPENQEQVIRDAVIEHLRENGVEVSTDWKEGQRIIDRYNGEASLNKHKVYHGTGAEFDAFDHSHMGEGEGYQTYGYGTYVTEVPAIGKGYAEKGARSKYRRMNPGYGDNEVRYKGEKIDLQTVNPLKMAYDVLESERTIKKAINTAERLKGLAEDPEMQQKWQTCIDILKDSKKSDFKARKADMTGQRFVYDVEIPDDNGKNYLSWEEPYDERLTNGLMEKLGADDYAKWAEQVNRLGFNNKSSEPYSGMNAYYALSQVLGSPKRASEILSELGYVGMKYPTNYQAGGNKKGTKNYVIFNEGDAKITDTMQFFKTPDGQAYGFAYGGKIFVDPRIATAETPVHEYSHLWIQAKRASSPEEWNEIKNVMLNDPLVQPIIERVKVDYPELTKEGKEDLFAEEIITQFSGKRGNERLHEITEEIAKEKGGVFGKAEAVAAMQRLKNILNRFWEGVAKMMGWKYRNANQIADRIMADMLNGVDPKQRAEREAQRIASQKVEEEKPIFISNAEKAVEAIKQEKATPEQWLAMIQKNGGLKAAEDKWLGLSEWLAEQNKSGKSVTKQELMDYIRQNQIKVEEEEYHDFNVEGQNKLNEFNQEFQELIAEGEEATGSIYVPDHVDWAFEQMVDRHGDDFRDAFEPQRGGDHWELIPQVGWDDEPTGAAKYYLDAGNVINSTRLDYTTNGLHNKKEIALTVPTIEPYKENDEIHFGDAGNGRAVAWIRFGETTDPDGKRVLVIDEIQSKRHQDAREKGYRKYAPSNAPALVKYETAKKAHNDYLNTLRDKYGRDDVSYGLTEEEQKESSRLWREAFDARAERNQYMRENSFGPFSNSDVPEAPFEKNWHELAMKRMLRYAAENGYDKIAWTTGNQQAERYSIGKVVEDITIEPYKAQSPTESDGRDLSVYLNDGTMYEMFVQPDGTINSDSDLFNGKKTSEVFGKDIAAKIAGADKRTFLRDADLRVGGEGMKGFYDDILPRFMNKYGKKWGVKVDNINLPQLESVAQKMHAVDVTPEMRESVMQGQPMFQKVSDEHKKAQLDIINSTNPMKDDYHTGIRKVDDIKSFDEAYEEAKKESADGGWDELASYPDITNEMIEEARRTGKIAIYSSYPIKNGTFVTPSEMQAKDYSGGERIYSKQVPLNDVAWINLDEGQYAKVTKKSDAKQLDKEYADAVAAGDKEKVDAMLRDEAKRKGYSDDSSYQGSIAFNGAAPSKNGYFETRADRKQAFEDGDFEGEYSLGDYVEAGIDNNDLEWQLNNPMRATAGHRASLESIHNINNAILSKSGKIKMYRAVDANVKENSFRNGDWVTPSREYAEQHIGLQDWKKGRIIEQEVPIDDIWWNGDDINEWGYDDGKAYAYKNTKNNRKLLEPTYDKDGNLIPLSKRFNSRKDDIMFQLVGKKGAAEADRRDEETIRMDNNRVAEEMEKAGKDANTIKLATGWERGKDGQWRYEVPDAKVNVLDAYRKAEQAKSNKLNELFKAYDKLNDQYYDLAGKIPSRMDNSYTEEQKAKVRQLRKEREKLFKQMNQARDAYWDYKEDVRNVTNTTLGEILGADNELFKYYPEMKDMQVQFSTIMDPGVAGSQEAGYGIKLNADELKRFENNDELNNDNIYGTLLHEIQHAIQETEGFAQGGNLRTATTKQGISEIVSQVRRKRNRILQNIDSNRKYLSDEKELELAAMLDGRTIEKERKRLNEELEDWTLEYDQLGSYIQHLEQTGRVTLSDARDLYRRLAGEVEARNVTNRMDMTPEERQQKLAEATEDVPRDNQVVIYPDGESGNISFHKVEDADELKKLKSEPTVKRYRAMQLIDGKLYPPMSAKVDGEMRQPTEIGVWEKAEERPDLVKNGKFVLNKAQKGQGNVPAAYNPYFHTSTSGLNDQFTSAYKRPELVVVEVEIPESELTSGYKAEGAKDTVGNVDWHSGVVNGQLPADRQRQVTLSRYSKVNRVVPDSEVADMIAKQLDGTDIAVPYNVVTPSLRAELEKKGVAISDKPAGTVTKDANGNPIRFQKVGSEENIKNGDTFRDSEKKERPLQEMPLKSSERFNGKHVKGLEEYENELRTKLAANPVEGGVDTDTASRVSDNTSDGFWDERKTKEGVETGSDRLHVGEPVEANGQRLGISQEERKEIEAELAAIEKEKERRKQVWNDFAKKYHVSADGHIWYKDYLKAFEDMNTDPEAKRLMDKVVNILEGDLGELSIKAGLNQRGNHDEGLLGDVEISQDWITRGVPDSEKAKTLLHELLHKVTIDNIELYSIPGFRRLMGKEAQAAVKELYAIHDELKKQYPDTYGSKDVKEMVAEMGDADLRKALQDITYDKNKNVTLWDRFKAAIKQLFTKDNGAEMVGNADKAALDALDKLLDAYDKNRSTILRTGRTAKDIAERIAFGDENSTDNRYYSEEGQPMFQRQGTPEEEMTPEERQYWNKWDADMKKWRERNAIPEGVDGPGEKPRFQQGETALAFAQRLMDHNRAKALWQTAPKLEDYRQKREDKDILDAARENEQRYPDSPAAKMRRVAAELQQIRHAMSQQKAYDKATVKAVTDFAQDFMKMGFGDNLSRGEMERMLSSVKNATGARDIKREVDNILNILMDNHLRNLDQRVQKLSSVKELSKTAQGVEKQGKLELKGQRMIKAFREAREGRMDADKIRERLYEVAEKMSRNDEEAPMWEQEYEGLSIALQYQENIEASRDEWAELDREYKDAVKNYKTSGRSYKDQQELLESLDQAMMENKIERIGLFGDIIGRLEGNISESMKGAKEFREKDAARIQKLYAIVNSDLAGKETRITRREGTLDRILQNDMLQLAFAPLGTFEQMLKQIGGRNVKGEGNTYNYLMNGYMDAVDNTYTGQVKVREELDAKAREIFGDKVKRWTDLYDITMKPGAEVTFLDGDKEITEQLSQGNMLYIYMANKMSDGKMKLRKMGITDEDVDAIKEALDPRLVQLGDWLQSEYLPQKRIEYNKVHERMFGAPMAAVENYFPIKVNRDAAFQDAEKYMLSKEGDKLPSAITGSIIKRTKNTIPLDILHTDAISLALEHLNEMEQWKSQAEWNRDVKDLLSYTTFRNKVKNMKTIYGSGTTLWNKLFDAATIATGDYNPKRGVADKTISNIAKGVTSAKINFRIFTAFKQLLSIPAFFHDTNTSYMAKAMLPHNYFYNNFKWAIENMPVFRKRWESRQIGDTRLMDDPSDWKIWKKKWMEKIQKGGMAANATIDALTCAAGAKAIYESRYKQYKEIGASDEIAHKQALKDAEIGYNLTQQSSEGAFVSTIQKDRTVAANALSVFRNGPFAYTRQAVDAIRNLSKMVQKGYKEDSIEFMTNQFKHKFNITEEQAKKAAEMEYAKAGRHEVAKLLNMMFGVTALWNLGAPGLYLLFGDDDKAKKEMATDAIVKSLAGGPVEGLAGGNIWSDIMGRALSEETRRTFANEGLGAAFDAALKQAGDYEVNPLPLMADIQSMIKKLGYDKYAAAQDVFNIAVQSYTGVNPQTITDIWNAAMDYGNPSWMPFTDKNVGNEDLSNSKEIALFIMRVLNAPTSAWRNKYIDELGMNAEDAKKLPYDEMAKRYANYKYWKDAPIMGWLRSDEVRQAKMEKIQEQFDKKVMERMERLSDEELQHNLARSSSPAEKRMYAKLVAQRLGLEPGATAKKSDDEDKWYQKYYQQLMQYDDIKEDETLATKVKELEKLNLERNKKALSEIKKRLEWIRNGKYDSKNGRPKKTENQADQFDLLNPGKMQLGSDDEKRNQQIMANIRKWRKEALELAIGAEM